MLHLVVNFSQSAFPKVAYKVWAFILSLVSMILANLGLTQILKSISTDSWIYLSSCINAYYFRLFHKYIEKYAYVYTVTVGIVAVFSAVDIFNKNVMMNQWTSVLKYIPFYMEGVGWIVPAIIGACIGVIVSIVINKNK